MSNQEQEAEITRSVAMVNSIVRDLETLHDIHAAMSILQFISDYFLRKQAADKRAFIESNAITLHPIQKRILEANTSIDIRRLTLRELGKLIGQTHPQLIKYHKDQLVGKGLL